MKPLSKSELAEQYGVHVNTMMKWVKMIPELNLKPKQILLTPKQLEMIYNFLGEP